MPLFSSAPSGREITGVFVVQSLAPKVTVLRQWLEAVRTLLQPCEAGAQQSKVLSQLETFNVPRKVESGSKIGTGENNEKKTVNPRDSKSPKVHLSLGVAICCLTHDP